MLEKVITHDCQVLEDGQMQCRRITRVMEDGKELSKSYNRWVLDVGDDMTDQPKLIKDIAKNMHTPARIAARVIVRQQNEI